MPIALYSAIFYILDINRRLVIETISKRTVLSNHFSRPESFGFFIVKRFSVTYVLYIWVLKRVCLL